MIIETHKTFAFFPRRILYGSLRVIRFAWWLIGYKELCPICERWNWYRAAGNVCRKCERKFTGSNDSNERQL